MLIIAELRLMRAESVGTELSLIKCVDKKVYAVVIQSVHTLNTRTNLIN